ncbi:putative porin [Alteromonas sp. ASW11-130]|uniref:putative porin n=1 Tax=Alteromonas sp. ASW11-130 TaxID=3015775 RepID=UPI002241FFAE|nr:putative porin [Alteromonas sp. ASW11-130]MCW8093199.1 putative porin [Alteromonas sp. ASW11-130]
MNKNISAVAFSILALSASTVNAGEYNSFLSTSYANVEGPGSIDFTTYSFFATHYFSARTTTGPYAEFDYMVNEAFLSGGYTHPEHGAAFKLVSGETFIGDIIVGGNYIDVHGTGNDFKSFLLGYRINNNLHVKARLLDTDDNNVELSVNYKHELDQGSYLGVTASTVTDTDAYSFNSKYFTQLSNETYLAVNAGVNIYDGMDNTWVSGVDYYFNQNVSVGGMVGSDSLVGVKANYYVNPNLSLSAGYSENDIEIKQWQVNLGYQF